MGRLRARRAAPALLLVTSAWIGCGGGPGSSGMVPDSARGRAAIASAMAGWKAGHPAGIVEPSTPRVQVGDTHRVPGQRLEGYEILGESADATARTFTVRLTLSGPDERPTVRFLAVGIDPVLVLREEDYEMLIHWEHRMDPDPREPADSPVSFAK